MTPRNRKPLVAIVDDDAFTRRSIQQLVWLNGMDGDAFTSAREFIEAIEVVPSFRPDCVVLAMELSELNGFEVLERLARSRPDVPVIALTGSPDALMPEVTPASGVAARFEKPLRRAAFIATLLHVLHGSSRESRSGSTDAGAALAPVQRRRC